MTVPALVLEAPRTLRRREFARPEIGEDDALLRVEACGLCGTDHEQFSGALPIGAPFVPGHEIVGTVERITAEAQARRGLTVGDRIALEVFQACGRCAPCQRGVSMLCARHGLRDMYGGTPLEVPPGLWGGYATHVLVSRDALVHRVPSTLDPIQATLFNPLGAGLRWAVNLPDLQSGAIVAILGPGLRGLCSVVAAGNAGAGFILLTGAGPADEARLQLGRRFGATVTVDVQRDDPVAVLRRETGGLADLVVDVTAAAPAAFPQALHLARPGGKVVVAGTRGTAVERFHPDIMVFKELTVLGARGVDGTAYSEALRVLATDTRFSTLPRRVVPLESSDVAPLLRDMAHDVDRPLHAVIAPHGD